MPDSPAQRFLDLLASQRDDLYARALAATGDPLRAEGLLQKLIHAAFPGFAQGAPADLSAHLTTLAAIPPEVPPAPMPADTWARLAGAIQIEATRLGGSKALNPDSVLLNPDPLLAPRKPKPPEDLPEPHHTHAWFLVALAAVILGVAITIYLTTCPHHAPATLPATANAPR